MMTRAAMSPGGSSSAAAAAAAMASLGPNASAAAAAMSALGPSASVAASMASMASGHQVGSLKKYARLGHLTLNHTFKIWSRLFTSSYCQASAAGLSASAANSAAATSYAALYAGLMGQSGLMGFPPGAAPPGFPSQGAPRKE